MKSFFAFLCFLALCMPLSTAFAQLEYLENYQDTYLNDDQGPGAKKVFNNINNPNNYIYEIPSLSALSHLYWAVNLYKFSDNDAIDEFMRLNECKIYKNFSTDEFEWAKIRDVTRQFLKTNKADFPTRFEFMVPLKLQDYDTRRQAFELQDIYKIDAVRRFEVFAKNFRSKPCSGDYGWSQGYPRGLVLEFSRPFTLTHIPMDPIVAEGYIKRKNIKMKKIDERFRTKKRMYNLRDAFLVIKVKIFTHGRFMGAHNFYKVPVVQMMAVLEGYEVYEDRRKENLFFSEVYVTNRAKKANVKLQDEYKILRERSEERGMLHYP